MSRSTSPTPSEGPGDGHLLRADLIAAQYRSELLSHLQEPTFRARAPTLVGVLSTAQEPARRYAEFTQRMCEELGVRYVLKEVGGARGGRDGEGAEEAVIEANEDESVDGIMVYYPIFGGGQDQYLQQVVSPLKDVEGLNFRFHYNLYHNIRFLKPSQLLKHNPLLPSDDPVTEGDHPPPGYVKSILPCTPLAVVKCLEYAGVYNRLLRYGDRAYGKTVTVVNRSEVVGRPLAALLSNDGARVFSVDLDGIQEYTKRPKEEKVRKYHPRHVVQPVQTELKDCLAISDVVISAVPSKEYKIKTEWLKDGCVCVNVASEKNFETDVKTRAALYIPAVGKVTITMLLRNLLRLREYNELAAAAATPPAPSTSSLIDRS
ncbi:methylenetetrahydrofolate dehydrogenase [Dacryopinax primogenitus]|uniref:Methylenetetrahydrofolate dehydrogenase n=1 Tax=Dacryopinax primogenitus (strain DJM 731) TaxID=1858805 RepID=M5GBK5_DACPD|nr:methylenetetrahydrofolate dehydrogenase [Dacryopinax primogenitus]EJU06349.1 methylenetetrahydrofolate dehydrogenase [Dacryopinax primogenitus]